MAKVLLVDTNFSSAPIYRALVAGGNEVHVVGRNPADCLAKVAAHYWQLDYSDTNALSALVHSQQFDYLVPGCTDRSYASCVALGQASFPGFDTPETASAISHKAHFRRVAAHLDLPVPKLHAGIAEAGGRPVIVKPVDAFSGNGITVLRKPDRVACDEAIARARAASPTDECLIEDYVEGQLYSHSAFLRERKVIRDFLVQENGTVNPFVVDTSRVLDGNANTTLMTVLRDCIEKLAAHLGLADGLVHTQFISDGEQVWLIEMTRRCPGDLYSQLIELSTGFPYAWCYASAFVGQEPPTSVDEAVRPIMRHTITVPAAQGFDHLRFLRTTGIERYVPLSLVGDPLLPSPRSRVAIVFCREESPHALDELYAATLERNLYVVSDGTDTGGVF